MSVSVTRSRPSRAVLAAEASLLRSVGLLGREIAVELGISRQYASALLCDPAGEKARARKGRYRRPCPSCNTLMDGSNGNGPNAPRLCAACSAAERHAAKTWTRAAVIGAVQRWAAEHEGKPPHSTDWPRRAEYWPNFAQVYGVGNQPFRAWADAIEAAGFPRPRIGGYERTPETLARLSAARTIWTPDLILAAVREWTTVNGRPPKYADWRKTGENHPCSATVYRVMGGWRSTIALALDTTTDRQRVALVGQPQKEADPSASCSPHS